MFSGGIEKEHRAVIGYANFSELMIFYSTWNLQKIVGFLKILGKPKIFV